MVVYLAVLYDVNTTKAALYCDNWGALNENEIPETSTITLPASIREPILPTDARRQREHPDLRLARRARTIANLARVISERKVKLGIRQTLCAQAKRLEQLAEARLESFYPGPDLLG